MENTLQEVVQAVKQLPGITGEICGTWLWVTGETKQHKDDLKKIGLKWSNNKTAWYWHSGGYRKKAKRDWQMSEIRAMFGSDDLN